MYSLHQPGLETGTPDLFIPEWILMMRDQPPPGFVCMDCPDGSRNCSSSIFAEIAVRSPFFDILPTYEF
jgi:hypothetical protein